MALDLVPIWTVILAVSVFMYVLLDGFDLGVGILFPFAPDDAARDTMMASVAPVWDGNETWLVMGGIGIFAAFPTRLRDHFPGAVFPGARDAAGARFSRRRVRVPSDRANEQRALGPRVLSGARSSRRSRRAACSASSCSASTSRGASSRAPHSTGCILSCSQSAWGSCSATRCSARRGSS